MSVARIITPKVFSSAFVFFSLLKKPLHLSQSRSIEIIDSLFFLFWDFFFFLINHFHHLRLIEFIREETRENGYGYGSDRCFPFFLRISSFSSSGIQIFQSFHGFYDSLCYYVSFLASFSKSWAYLVLRICPDLGFWI